jgi:hypothetical protein
MITLTSKIQEELIDRAITLFNSNNESLEDFKKELLIFLASTILI